MARDTNFYYAFLVLPAEKRRAIVAVWDFCRAVDDAVDEIAAEGIEKDIAARQAIAQWRTELACCFDGDARTGEGRALIPFIRRFHLHRQPFEALIEGVEMDLGRRRYETFADLYEYCIRVASAVGLICLDIFECQDPRSRQYAVDLGVALQLTNILRDVPVDLANGRLYIPLEDMVAHGCTEDNLREEASRAVTGVRSAAVKRLLRQQAQRAAGFYERAAASLPPVDARRLVPAEIMGAIYRSLLRRIERADYDVFSRVIRIPRPWRAAIAAATWVRTVVLRP